MAADEELVTCYTRDPGRAKDALKWIDVRSKKRGLNSETISI